MSKFLDEVGFTYAWNRIKAYVDGKLPTITATVINTTGTPSVTRTESNDAINFAFSGLKGETGATGPTGPKGDTAQTEEIYSTNETKIGTWVDGRPLYRKVIKVNSPSTATEWVTIIPATPNLKEMTNLHVLLYDGFSYYPINYYGSPGYSSLVLYNKSIGLQMYVTSQYTNKPCTVIACFTKTTD